jgi:D-galactarolactone cycloisomerase
MRIDAVRALPITYVGNRDQPRKYLFEHPMNLLFVRIEAEGIVGYGEVCDSYGCYYGRSIQVLIEEAFSSMLIGEELDSVERLASKMRGWTRRRLGDQGMGVQAISGVEIALWDLLGKAEGKSISQLLGRYRDHIPVYASSTFIEEGSPEFHMELLEPCLKQGVKGVKVRIGFDFRRDLKTLKGLRALLGDDIRIMIDGSEHFSVLTALEIARGLDDIGVSFFEEPVPQCNREGIARLVRDSRVPIAYGEHLFTLNDFQDCLIHGYADVVQPDAAICGGIAEGKGAAALAKTFGIPVVLHSCAGPAALAANLHLAASAPNIHMVEYAFTVDRVWKDMLHDPMLSPVSLRDGMLPVPDGPGLGLPIDEEICARNPYVAPGPVTQMPTWSLGHV